MGATCVPVGLDVPLDCFADDSPVEIDFRKPLRCFRVIVFGIGEPKWILLLWVVSLVEGLKKDERATRGLQLINAAYGPVASLAAR